MAEAIKYPLKECEQCKLNWNWEAYEDCSALEGCISEYKYSLTVMGE